jgi:hypothetical protein
LHHHKGGLPPQNVEEIKMMMNVVLTLLARLHEEGQGWSNTF